MKSSKEMVKSLLARRDAYDARRRQQKKTVMRIASAVCAFAVVAAVGVGLWQGGAFDTETPPTLEQPDKETEPTIGAENTCPPYFALAEPHYPEMVQRPAEYEQEAHDAWYESLRAQRSQIGEHGEGMTDYYAATMKQFLAGEAGENRVYSPLNLYLALAMLAETTEGDSRQQILDLLGAEDLPALRERCSGLWNGVYLDDGAVVSRLANSLWLAKSDRWQYDTDTVKRLADRYYASVFRGEMGSADYNRALQDWLNHQTNGLLKQQAQELGFDPDTALALASTICFQAKWNEWFVAENTAPAVFHTAGGDVTCDFLHDTTSGMAYFGDKFTRVSRSLDDGAYSMEFYLPKEGVTAEELVSDPQFFEAMNHYEMQDNKKYLEIRLSVPKFDVTSDRDLKAGLQALGVTDVFDFEKSNFGGIFAEQTEPVKLDKVQHAARVAIDEEGVTAAAYTVEILCGAGAPSDVLDFTLDRPFVFAITGPGNTVLFSGVVENP